ncbi:MAG TPA: PqqD family peptide modification chaperone [Longimicrobiaceae bacterium]|nr:PqqD family peptide modification chaperone [Longimicrobiaceae bacterium]
MDRSVVAASSNLVAAELGEEVVILNLKDAQYFGLKEIGLRVWQLLQRPVTMGEIEAVVLEEYDVEPERCREELSRLVSGLVERGLVEVKESG